MERASKRRKVSQANGAQLPGFTNYDLEADYQERLQRKKKDEKRAKLPIKTAEGAIEQHYHEPEVEKVEEDVDSFLASGDDADKDSGVADLKPEPRKPTLSSKEQVIQAKEELARIAGLLGESPEDHIGLLGGLAEFAQSHNVTVKKLALGTQLAVYKDIIPGYRIRPLSQEDMTAKLSKDVRKLRSFEQGLLSGYKQYVQELGKLSKRTGGKEDAAIVSVATTCACNLLENVAHFNCRNDLISILVNKLSARRLDQDVQKCVAGLERLFQEDKEGHASLEAISQVTKMMKARNWQVNESVLNTFLHLRLLNEFSGKASTNHVDKRQDIHAEAPQKKTKFKKEFRTKRERKLMRERKDVEKEMKEADAAVSYEERDKNQAETLKLVFVAYFRILKARVDHLMGAVLEGLARYAHLINQDFFGDVLEVLRDLINEAESMLNDAAEDEDEVDAKAQRNATREALLCVTTAFALLQGQVDVAKSANALNLDLNFFITHLYRTLLPLALNPDIELSAKSQHLADPNRLPTPAGKESKVNVATTTVLLLRSLQSVLLPPIGTKSVPPLRIAAFVKQLFTLSLQLPQKSTIALLGLCQQVTKTHGTKIAALWYTEERKGDGVFDALSGEVEGSNPFAATVWEGELLRCHFDPRVRDAVKAIEMNVRQDKQ